MASLELFSYLDLIKCLSGVALVWAGIIICKHRISLGVFLIIGGLLVFVL